MSPEPTRPFPFPDGYWQDHRNKLSDKSIRDYVAIFERFRDHRPGGKFAPVDIQEIMRLAEDVGSVHRHETAYIRELTERHSDYFRNADQINVLRRFAQVHETVREAREDDFVEEILEVPPIEFFREPAALDFIAKAQQLSALVIENEAYYSRHGTFSPERVERVNAVAAELGALLEGFTLSDVDKPGREQRRAHQRDIHNLLTRLGGKTDHEAKFSHGRWVNWNRDITVYPERYKKPRNRAEMVQLLKQPGPLRMAAGGHAFNIACSMGGRKDAPIGTLVTLDEYRLDDDRLWRPVEPDDAEDRYKVSSDQATRVVRVSAGIRLRDFGKAMWAAGMALPVAGSTDAQSIGGLIATDLHSTGHTAGFLSQQLLELTALDSRGNPATFVRDDSVARGQAGRWTFNTAAGVSRPLAWLPVSGALGTTGVVVEAVVMLHPAFNLRKGTQFVPRTWAEENIARLLDPAQTDPVFAYDHVSFYYAGGEGPDLKTVRMNSWRRTQEEASKGVEQLKTVREIFDHVGSAFLPEYLQRLSRRQAPVPGQPPADDDDDWLIKLNGRKLLVLPANEAFARKLFFQHDEIEVGIPLAPSGAVDYDIFRSAIVDVQELLKREEFDTIIEVRFTPDASEAMLGPGTGGPTCYIELATPLGEYSRSRIVEVFHAFDDLMRQRYRARPHLGKKTTADFNDMSGLYGPVWDDFQTVRQEMDPDGKFLPADNALLHQIFKP